MSFENWISTRYSLILLPVLLPSPAFAQSTNPQAQLLNACSAVLNIDRVASTSSALTKLAMDSVFNASPDRDTSMSGGGNYGVISGHGSYDSHDQSQTSSVTNTSYSQEEFASLISAKLSATGAGSFDHCVDGVLGSPGLHVTTLSADSDQATLRVRYVPQPGTVAGPMSLHVITNGELVPNQDLTVQQSGYTGDLIFNVINPSRSLRILVQVFENQHQVAAISTQIPVITSVQDFSDERGVTSQVSSAFCGGYHHTQTVDGPTVDLAADPGYKFEMGTLELAHAQISGDRASAPEAWGAYDTQGLTRIAAHAHCTVPDGNNFYQAAIQLKINELKTGSYIQLPADNGRATPMKSFP